MTRYFRVYRSVRDHLQGGGSKHAAYLAVAKKLSTPYDTVKKHYARMRRSIEAAKVAGVDSFTKEEGIIDSWLSLYSVDREQQQDDLFVQQQTEHPVEFAFTAPERRQLQRVSRAFAWQLAMERLELIELRKRKHK